MLKDSVSVSGMNPAARIPMSQDSFFRANPELLAAGNYNASSFFQSGDSTNLGLNDFSGHFANGGYISGKSGIDQIPAMLSEGEYVIRASSARQIGKPMLDRINAGKFNDGGIVDKMEESQEASGTSGNTNNINISINIEGGSTNEQSNSSDNSPVSKNSGGQEKDKFSNMAKKIKDQVLSVIVEEQRPGGLLS